MSEVTFSVRIKDEICSQPVSHRDAGLELGMALLAAGRWKEDSVTLSSTHRPTAERFANAFNQSLDVAVQQSSSGELVSLSVTSPHEIAIVSYFLRQTFAFDTAGQRFTDKPVFDAADVSACLRGHFLAAGSISDPVRAYHDAAHFPAIAVARSA